MSIQLAYSTQDPQVDTMLQGVIGLAESIFPGRVRACYLTGSLANGTAVYGSDVDVIIVFKDELEDGKTEGCLQTSLHTTLISARRIDLAARSEAELMRTGATGIKLATRLLYGEDIREWIPLEPLEQFRHHVTGGFVFYSWAGWLVELFERCKFQWQHRVPDDLAERAHLRRLLERALDFENDVLYRCRPYVDKDTPVVYQEFVV